MGMIKFPDDIKKLKNFIKNNYGLVLSDEKIQDLWIDYSDYFAAGWLSLPDKIEILKEDRYFLEVLKKYSSDYLFLLFEIKDCIPLYKTSIKLNYLDIINENIKEKLLNLVPEIEKNYYSTILNKWNFKDFFIQINIKNKNYILYILNENKNNSNQVEEFFNFIN